MSYKKLVKKLLQFNRKAERCNKRFLLLQNQTMNCIIHGLLSAEKLRKMQT